MIKADDLVYFNKGLAIFTIRLKYTPRGCIGFDVGSDAQQGMSS